MYNSYKFTPVAYDNPMDIKNIVRKWNSTLPSSYDRNTNPVDKKICFKNEQNNLSI